MHIIVSWDISATGAAWSTVNERMVDALKPLNWVKPVNTFYLAPVISVAQRNTVLQRLQSTARMQPVTVKVIVSPVLPKGLYGGILKPAEWAAINTRL
jgi:hypothetical protein